jgi:RHS repeat-associated protein
MTQPPPKGTPSPGFDLRVETRLPPDGKPVLELDPGKRHEIVVHVPGGEAPGATVPEAGRASAGMGLPKLGEKWSTSAPTGQGGVAIGVPLAAGRGVTPQIAIAYTTADGNGPFGWGWRGPVPYFVRTSTKAIVREHGRGLPEYDDGAESDVFAFSDADELVKIGEGIDPGSGAVVVTYRARTEGSFARIERHEIGGRSHFVVRGADNVVSIYGQQAEACVTDPGDPTRVFQWFLQQQHDDRGNVAVYRYKAEDLTGVDTGAGSERSRGGEQPGRYVKRILYGNRDVADDAPIALASLDDEAARARYMFEVVFDYGEHTVGAGASVDDDHGWPVRPDAFSGGRAGFEVRTRRLCRRVLVFHRFAQLSGAGCEPVLVRALELDYDEDPAASRLVSAHLVGYGGEGSITLPKRRFTYTPRSIAAKTRTIDHEATGGLSLALDRIDAEWFDLDGTGSSGLLTRENGCFVYRAAGDVPGTLCEPQKIAFGATPSTDPAVHLQRWMDVSGRGQPALVELGPSDATVFERDEHGVWQSAQVASGSTPPVGKDPIAEQHRIYLVDLDGDGITDVLVAKEGSFCWWRRMGAAPGDGWQPQDPIAHDGDEDAGPGPVLFDAARDLAPEAAPRTEAIVLADMTGDGLCDVVRIRSDEIAYWPNLGYGRFGGKVVLGAGPGAAVDPTHVRVCDVDGLGPSDLLILQPGGGGTLWLNEAGNRLVAGPTIATPPLADLALSSLGRVDGSPTGSLVWAPKVAKPSLTIVDFVATPPLLLVRDEGGTGLRTTIRYGTSSEHARRAKIAGAPWRTRLPVVIPVVEGVVVEDLVRGTRFSSSYRYAHGHYDASEREFRGFGFVEQLDEEAVDAAAQTSAHQSAAPEHTMAPTRTRSWFWNGSGIDLGDEYDGSDSAAILLPPPAFGDLGQDDAREASRALRGVLLRAESYSDAPGPGGDVDAIARPIATTTHAWAVRVVQAKGAEHHASVQPVAEQTLTYTYERQAVPDPRLVQTAVLERDDLGFVTRTATVAYPRRAAVPEPSVIEPRDPKPDPGAPSSVLLRLVDFAFDTDKSFVLPGAMPGIAVLASQCAAQQGHGEVLVIGHTDRVGADEANLGISLQRARRVVELLRHDVDGWLALYDASIPASIRWGAHEDALMLAAVGEGGVEVGDLDAATRRALVQRYMALGGAAVADALPLRAIGAGEAYAIEMTGDGVASAANRRIEAFFFADVIEPPAPEKFLPPDAPEYATWIARVTQQADIDVVTGAVSGIEGAGIVPPPPVEARPAAAISSAPLDGPQLRTAFVVSEVDLVHQEDPDVHRLGTAIESRSFEVHGKPGDPRAPMSLAALKAAASGGAVIPFEQTPSGAHQRRLVARARTYFYDDALTQKADLGVVGKRGLVAKTLTMAFTDAHAERVLGPMMVASRKEDWAGVCKAGGYLSEAGGWWVPSSRPMYSAAAFYQSIATIDPFGNRTLEVTYDRDHYLVVRQVTLPAEGLKLMSSVSYEYRTFGARGSFDPNGSATIRRFDALGRVTSEVRRGDPSGRAIEGSQDEQAMRPEAFGSEGDDDDTPTVHYTYDDHAFVERGAPCSMTRGVKLEYGKRELRVSLGVTYFDGAGAVLQSKVRTDDGRWRASGRTVVNNKGLPVLTYAPFVSGSAGYDPGASQLMARMHYDGLGRLVRTDGPDGTHERVELGAWEITAFDRSDTVLESEWLVANEGGTPAQRAAAAGAVTHANTPTTTRLDVLGRPCAVFVRYRDEDGGDVVVVTRQHLDGAGNVLELVDARGNVAEQREHGMLGQVLIARSVDAGETRAIADVVGAPLRAIDARGNVAFIEYDVLRRPLEDWISVPGHGEVLLTKRVWGNGVSDGSGARHLGRLVRVYDGGGETRIDAYDLDGNATEVSRRIVDLPLMLKAAQVEGRTPRTRVDWSALHGCDTLAAIDAMLPMLAPLQDKTYRSTARHDAQGRVVENTLPMSGSTHRTRYTEDGLLRRIDRETAAGTTERVYEADDFDHLGRPRTVHHGDAARTSFTYDPVTERLLRLQSRGGGKALQDLQYTYDPSGNITQVRDGAQAAIVRDNAVLEAVNDYRYDALYRLVEATGREHEGQAANGRTPRTGDAQVIPLRASSPNDPKAMRRYVQRFRYDAVGNLMTLRHHAGAGSFRREYAYAEHGNRLRATGNAAVALGERYEHDVAGHMVAMPHLARLHWDELGQLEYVQRGTQHVWLQYAGGVRVRKLVFSGEGVVEDRVYLGGEEMFVKRRAGVVVEQTLTEHVGGGLQVDVKLVAEGKAVSKPVALRRYALGDHLGSTKLEVDADGRVIAYEEFHAYGTTSYRAMRSGLDAAAGRFRYTGMERDEETGLAQHGARYYAAWLGRWTSADPIGIEDGVNRFAYAGNRPIGSNDTTGLAEQPSALDVERLILLAHKIGIDAQIAAIDAEDRQLAEDRAALDAGIRRSRSELTALQSSLRLAHSYSRARGFNDVPVWVMPSLDEVGDAIVSDFKQRPIAYWPVIGSLIEAGSDGFNAADAVARGQYLEASGDAASGFSNIALAYLDAFSFGLATPAKTTAWRTVTAFAKGGGTTARRGAIVAVEAGTKGVGSAGGVAEFDGWARTLPQKKTPTTTPNDRYEVAQTGEQNYLVSGGGEKIWADGLDSASTSVLEAKFIADPARSPFVAGSSVPEFIRTKIVAEVTDEFRRYGAVVADPSNPLTQVQVIVNDAAAAPFFADLMRRLEIPGHVVVRR